MATITITRGLSGLTSAFNPSTIEFTINTGVVPTVSINSLSFAATKTATNIGGFDTYVFDLTDILPYLLGFPPEDYTSLDLYRKQITISLSAIATTTVNLTTYLCFGYDKIAEFGSLVSDIQSDGRRGTCYHHGAIGFYFGGSAGSYNVTIGTTTQAMYLVAGYNILSLFGDLSGKSGLLTIDGTSIDFRTYYTPTKYSQSVNNLVKWINKDGSYSEADFKLQTTDNDIKSSNEIPIYKSQLSDTRQRSREIEKKKTVVFNLYTIAINPEHYSQLTEIAESPVVYYADMICKVSSYNKSYSLEKQNLRFNLSLQIEDYVATY